MPFSGGAIGSSFGSGIASAAPATIGPITTQSTGHYGSALGLPKSVDEAYLEQVLGANLRALLSGKPEPASPALNNRPDMNQSNANLKLDETVAGQAPSPYGISPGDEKPAMPVEVQQARARAGSQQLQRDNALKSRARLISALNDEQSTLYEIQSKQPSNRELIALQRMANPDDLFSPLHSAAETVKNYESRVAGGERLGRIGKGQYQRALHALGQAEQAGKALQAVKSVNDRLADVKREKQAAADEAQGISSLPQGPTPDQAGKAAEAKIAARIAKEDKRTQKEKDMAEAKKAAEIKARKKDAQAQFDRQLQGSIQLGKVAKEKLKAIDEKTEAWAKSHGIRATSSDPEDLARKKAYKEALGKNWQALKTKQQDKVTQMQARKAKGLDAVVELKPAEQSEIDQLKQEFPNVDPSIIEEKYRKHAGLQ